MVRTLASAWDPDAQLASYPVQDQQNLTRPNHTSKLLQYCSTTTLSMTTFINTLGISVSWVHLQT